MPTRSQLWLTAIATASGFIEFDKLMFPGMASLVQGKPEAVKAKLQQDLLPAFKVNWILWIAAQFINYKFVPPKLEVRAHLSSARSSLSTCCTPSISHAHENWPRMLYPPLWFGVAGAGGQCHCTHLECVHVVPEPQDGGALASMPCRH